MARTTRIPAMAAVLALSLTFVPGPSATAQEFLVPFVTINEAPDGAAVAPGEHLDAAEMSNTRPVAEGPVGPLPVFVADDEYGCDYTTAAASGVSEWIAVARRGPATEHQCGLFQTKVTVASGAGADGLIIVNYAPGTEAGTAAGPIPAVMVDQARGGHLIDAADPATPDALQVTLEMLDAETKLPPGTVTPTSVTGVAATREGDILRVSGTAAFRGEGPVLVAEDLPGDGPLHPETAADAGVDIVGAYISQPDPGVPELLFEWEVTELPASGSLPEIVRYGFPFKAGTAGFMAQAKFSNVVSGTLQDDPQGHAEHVAGNAFQLRGGCAPDEAGVIACAHVEWLSGEFDTARDRVKVRVPIGGPNTSTVQPGVEIVSNPDSLGGNPTASFQAYVSNNTTEDEAIWDPSTAYTVPERTVRLGLVAVGAPAAYSAAGTAGGSSFEGTLDVAGKTGTFDLVVEACFGTNCGTSRTTITL